MCGGEKRHYANTETYSEAAESVAT